MKKRLLLLGMFVLLFSFLVNAQCLDVDNDGYGIYVGGDCREVGVDCDDTDPTTYPHATELCDYWDNDCDGLIDEGGDCAPVCGNGECDGDETSDTCDVDCGPVISFCGDSTCDVDEDCSNCQNDCGVCPIDFGTCEVSSAEWFDLSGNSLDYANDGDTVKLIANIVNPSGPISECNNLPLTFSLSEVDNIDEDGYAVFDSSIIEIEETVSNGKAFYEWDVVYDEVNPDDVNFNDDANPEYVLVGIFYDELNQVISYSNPERYFVVFPTGYNPDPEEINGTLNQNGTLPGGENQNGNLSQAVCGDFFCRDGEDFTTCPEDCPEVDVCGDGICGASETYDDCFVDCQAENPFFGCYFNSVNWVDLDGNSIEPDDPEGSLVAIPSDTTINLVANVSGCEGNTLTFKIYEIDFDENYVILNDMEEISSLEATITNDMAVAEWITFFASEEDDGITGINPEYILVASLEKSGKDPFDTSNDNDILVVYPMGENSDDIDTTYTTADDNYVDNLQSSSSGTVYKGATGLSPKLYQGQTEDVCGDGVCGDFENEEFCPEDCVGLSGGIAATIFFVIIIIFILGGVGFFLYKKFIVKKKFIKEAQEQEKVMGSQGPQIKPFQQTKVEQVQQSTQPPTEQVQQPTQFIQPPTDQLKNPFSNNQLFQQTINFIKTAKIQGLTDDKIKEMLKKGNYSQEQIDYVFSQNL
jgi:hypothetical protein